LQIRKRGYDEGQVHQALADVGRVVCPRNAVQHLGASSSLREMVVAVHVYGCLRASFLRFPVTAWKPLWMAATLH